jgi:hypothetical protein
MKHTTEELYAAHGRIDTCDERPPLAVAPLSHAEHVEKLAKEYGETYTVQCAAERKFGEAEKALEAARLELDGARKVFAQCVEALIEAVK